MKNFSLLLLFTISLSGFSQVVNTYNYMSDIEKQELKTFYDYSFYSFNYSNDYKKIIAEKKIESKKLETFIVKNGVQSKAAKYVNTSSYDINGNTLNWIRIIYGDTTYTQSYTYFNEKIESIKAIKKNKKIVLNDVYTFDNNGNKLSYTKYKSGNEPKIKRKWLAKYDENGNQISVENFHGDKLKDKWTYKYTDDKRLKESCSYNGKGKLEHKWSYDCSDDGKIVTKDTTQVCVINEYDNLGNRTVVYRNTSYNNKTYKSKYVYNKDSVLIEMAHYNKKDIATFRYTRTIDNNKKPLEIVYYKKGGIIPSHKYVNTYNRAGKLICYVHFSKNAEVQKDKYIYVYNIDDQLIETKVLRKAEEKLLNRKEYKYDSKGNEIELKSYNKDNELVKVRNCSYTFY